MSDTKTRYYAVFNETAGKWERKPVKLRIIKTVRPAEPDGPLKEASTPAPTKADK